MIDAGHSVDQILSNWLFLVSGLPLFNSTDFTPLTLEVILHIFFVDVVNFLSCSGQI